MMEDKKEVLSSAKAEGKRNIVWNYYVESPEYHKNDSRMFNWSLTKSNVMTVFKGVLISSSWTWHV